MGSKEVFKAGSALAGGVAMMGETCGALTGAIMAVGCLVGRERLEDREQHKKAMQIGNRVCILFRDQIGHTICKEIHKIRYGKAYSFISPEESDAFHKNGGHSRKGCPEVCGVAAKIAAEMILDIREKSG